MTIIQSGTCTDTKDLCISVQVPINQRGKLNTYRRQAARQAGKAGATRDTSSFVNEIHVPSRILLLDVSFAVP